MSSFGNLGPTVKPSRSRIEKSITRSTLVSAVRQTCTTVTDRVCCEKHSAAWSVTAGVVNYLCFAVIGDRRSACVDIHQSGQLACLFICLITYLFIHSFILTKEGQCKQTNQLDKHKAPLSNFSSFFNLLKYHHSHQ